MEFKGSPPTLKPFSKGGTVPDVAVSAFSARPGRGAGLGLGLVQWETQALSGTSPILSRDRSWKIIKRPGMVLTRTMGEKLKGPQGSWTLRAAPNLCRLPSKFQGVPQMDGFLLAFTANVVQKGFLAPKSAPDCSALT